MEGIEPGYAAIKNCEICGMKKKRGEHTARCFLCGIGIHGKPRTLHEEDKFLRFCCDKCLMQYLNKSW